MVSFWSLRESGGMAAHTEGAVPRCATVIYHVEELQAAKTLRDHVGFALSFNLDAEPSYSFNVEYGFCSGRKQIKINDMLCCIMKDRGFASWLRL